jgi:3-hydroxyisobutyrate dehydrogenase-like beta-hydroxyacid dehydrogenase
MRIGTIGAGFVAHPVATVAIRHGHEVMVFGGIVYVI